MKSGPLLLALDSISHQLMATPALYWLKFLTILTHPSIYQWILRLLWKATMFLHCLHLAHAMTIFHQNHCNTVTVALASTLDPYPFISSKAIRSPFQIEVRSCLTWLKTFQELLTHSEQEPKPNSGLEGPPGPKPTCTLLVLSPSISPSTTLLQPSRLPPSPKHDKQHSHLWNWNTFPTSYLWNSIPFRLSLNHWFLHFPHDTIWIILFKCVSCLQPWDKHDSLCPLHLFHVTYHLLISYITFIHYAYFYWYPIPKYRSSSKTYLFSVLLIYSNQPEKCLAYGTHLINSC